MLRPTYVEVDLHAIIYNVQRVRDILSTNTALMGVVKADGYGHGLLPTARAMLSAGAEMLGVAIVEEGIALREAGVTASILVLGLALPEAAHDIVKHDLIQTVCMPAEIEVLDAAARAQGMRAYVHIKVDTGMNRIGLKTPPELTAMLDAVEHSPNVCLCGLYTHFSMSQEGDSTLARDDVFMSYAAAVRKRGFSPQLHAANSAAVLRFSRVHHDIVRPGLVLYGANPCPQRDIQLRPAMRWLTKVVYLKRVSAGETISYDDTYAFRHDSVVATLPVGYGDGYCRLLSSRGFVLIRGRRAPVVGRVCMDQTMVDVTEIPDVHLHDEAVLLGAQGDEAISADEMAAWSDTISHEVLVRALPRMPRVYI